MSIQFLAWMLLKTDGVQISLMIALHKQLQTAIKVYWVTLEIEAGNHREYFSNLGLLLFVAMYTLSL